MSKKRKTRKQKEIAAKRHAEQIEHEHLEPTLYSIPDLKLPKKETEQKLVVKAPDEIAQKDIAYLKHDISSIVAASGIIVAFDILLFVLLTTGTLRLNILGY